MERDERTGAVLRETARLHLQLQRAAVTGCDGTTSTQCFLISELGRSGVLTLAELGRRLGFDKSWTSRAVDALVAEGIVTKVPGDDDRRTVRVSLTQAGRARFEVLNDTLDAQAERVLSRVPEPQRERVVEALRLVRDALRNEISGWSAVDVPPCGTGGGVTFRTVEKDELEAVQRLVSSTGLPTDGLRQENLELIGAFRNGSLVGCAGLELYGADALLRSVAVVDSERGNGVGKALTVRMLEEAEKRRLKRLVLLTTTAETFFRRFGFRKIPRGQSPESVRASVEFQGVCPKSAAVMLLRVKKTIAR